MEMVKEKRRYIIIVVIIFIVAVLVFFANRTKDKMVIRVDGWDMEYTISERKLVIEDFENIELGSSLDEIENKLGKPDGWVGGGILLPVYVLEDNSAVELVFKNSTTYEDLEAIYLYNEQKESVIKKNRNLSDIEKQINEFVKNSDEWSDINGYFCFTVADLNQDGKVELIVSTVQGSGSYTYTKYYEIEENGNGIKEIQTDDYSVGIINEFLNKSHVSNSTDEKEYDGITYVPVFHDKEQDKYCFICYDYSGHTPYESNEKIYSLSLENNRIVEKLLVYKTSKSEEPNGLIQSIEYRDSNGNQISEDEYNKVFDNLFKENEKMEMAWQWTRVETKTELEEMDARELNELLLSTFSNFEIYPVE